MAYPLELSTFEYAVRHAIASDSIEQVNACWSTAAAELATETDPARKATLEKLRDQLTAWKRSNGYPL